MLPRRTSSKDNKLPANFSKQPSIKNNHISGVYYINYLKYAHIGYVPALLNPDTPIENGKFYVCGADDGIQYALLNHDNQIVRNTILLSDLKAMKIEFDLSEKPVTLDRIVKFFEQIVLFAAARGHQNRGDILLANKLKLYINVCNRPFDDRKAILAKMSEPDRQNFEYSMNQHTALVEEALEKHQIQFPINLAELKKILLLVVPTIYGITTVFRMAVSHELKLQPERPDYAEMKTALDAFCSGYVYHVIISINNAKFANVVDPYHVMRRRFHQQLLDIYDKKPSDDNDYTPLFLSKVESFFEQGVLGHANQIILMISMFGEISAALYLKKFLGFLKECNETEKDPVLTAMLMVLPSLNQYQDIYNQASAALPEFLNELWSKRFFSLNSCDSMSFTQKLAKLYYYQTKLSDYKTPEIIVGSVIPGLNDVSKFKDNANNNLLNACFGIYYLALEKNCLSAFDVIYINKILPLNHTARVKFNDKFFEVEKAFISSVIKEKPQLEDIFNIDTLFEALKLLTNKDDILEQRFKKSIIAHLIQFILAYDFKNHPTSRLSAPLLSTDGDSPLNTPASSLSLSRGSSSRSSARSSVRSSLANLRKALTKNNSKTFPSPTQSTLSNATFKKTGSATTIPRDQLTGSTSSRSPKPEAVLKSTQISSVENFRQETPSLVSNQPVYQQPKPPATISPHKCRTLLTIPAPLKSDDLASQTNRAETVFSTSLATDYVASVPNASSSLASTISPVKPLPLARITRTVSDNQIQVPVLTQADVIIKLLDASPQAISLLMLQEGKLSPETLQDDRVQTAFKSFRAEKTRSAASPRGTGASSVVRAASLPEESTRSGVVLKRSQSLLPSIWRRNPSLEKPPGAADEKEKDKKEKNKKEKNIAGRRG